MRSSLAPNLERGGKAPAFKAQLPRRHQRSRKKGAKTPDGVRYVGRPTLFGNPFSSKRFGHARSVALYRIWLEGRMGALTLERLGFCPAQIEAIFRWRSKLDRKLHQLAGVDLQCWCPLSSRWCHAQILIEYVAKKAGQRLDGIA